MVVYYLKCILHIANFSALWFKFQISILLSPAPLCLPCPADPMFCLVTRPLQVRSILDYDIDIHPLPIEEKAYTALNMNYSVAGFQVTAEFSDLNSFLKKVQKKSSSSGFQLQQHLYSSPPCRLLEFC